MSAPLQCMGCPRDMGMEHHSICRIFPCSRTGGGVLRDACSVSGRVPFAGGIAPIHRGWAGAPLLPRAGPGEGLCGKHLGGQ